MPEDESRGKSSYSERAHDGVRRFIRKFLEEYEERRLGRLTDDRCKNVVLAFFKEAHERAKGNVCTSVFEVMGQTAVKTVFTGGAEELLDDQMYKLSESQDFTCSLVLHLKKSSTFTVSVVRFVKQQAEKPSLVKRGLDKV